MAREKLGIEIDATVKGRREVKELNDALDGTGESTKRAAKGTDDFSKKMEKLIIGGVVVAGARMLFQFGKASLETASNVQEMQSKFDTVFRDLAGPVTDDLATFADAANRSKTDLMGFAATLQDTFVPLGFARDEAASMSVQLVKLAEDLASFNNVDSATVVRDLQSALVGNTETLRKYGVVASQAAIENEAYTSGLWDGEGAITAQMKAQAILNLTIAGTTDAQGDAIKTSGSYENVTKGLSAAMTDLKVVIGQGLLPAMTEAATKTTTLVRTMTDGIMATQGLKLLFDEGKISGVRYAAMLAEMTSSQAGANRVVAQMEPLLKELNAEQEKAARIAAVYTAEQAEMEEAYQRSLVAMEPVILTTEQLAAATKEAASADAVLTMQHEAHTTVTDSLSFAMVGFIEHLDLAALREGILENRTMLANAELRKQANEVVPAVITSFGYMIAKFGEAEARIRALNAGLTEMDGRQVNVDVNVRTHGEVPVITGGSDKGKASGGFVQGGGSYLVGEMGPELFTPSVPGHIAPNSSTGGGGNTINVYVSGMGRGGQQMGAQIASAVTDALGRLN